MKNYNWLWKALLAATVVLLIGGCAKAPTEEAPPQETAPPVEEAPTQEIATPVEEATPEKEAEAFIVCFIWDGYMTDGGFSYSQDLGRQYLEEQVPDVETRYIEGVPAGADAERVLTQLAEEGCQLIIGTSFQYTEATAAVAAKYPEAIFENYSSYLIGENYGSYNVRIDQPYYLNGMMLGLLTKTNKIGFVAPFPIPQVMQCINALTLGARSVNPEVTVSVVWTNAWYDLAKEKEATDSLFAAGCDGFAHYVAGTAVLQAAEEHGAYSVGASTDQCPIAPEGCLSSAAYDWGPIFVKLTQTIIDGTWVSEEWFATMVDGAAILTPYGPAVTDEVKGIVDAKKAELEAGTTDVFVGPIYDRDGNLRVPEGESLSIEGIQTMDWFVEGVLGSTPE